MLSPAHLMLCYLGLLISDAVSPNTLLSILAFLLPGFVASQPPNRMTNSAPNTLNYAVLAFMSHCKHCSAVFHEVVIFQSVLHVVDVDI